MKRIDQLADGVLDSDVLPPIEGRPARIHSWLFHDDPAMHCLLVFKFCDCSLVAMVDGLPVGVFHRRDVLASRIEPDDRIAKVAVSYAAEVCLEVATPSAQVAAESPEYAARLRALGRRDLNRLMQRLDGTGTPVTTKYRQAMEP